MRMRSDQLCECGVGKMVGRVVLAASARGLTVVPE
jgi:hypothetical protein